MSKSPNDKKNIERQEKLRYASERSGSIHGDTNYEIQTQEAVFWILRAQVRVI